MNETTDTQAAAALELPALEASGNDSNGVFAELGALPAGAIVTEDALARIFKRHPASVKRAIDRGELPAPARLFGGNSWTAGAIVRHVEKRMEAAAKRVEQKERIFQKHTI